MTTKTPRMKLLLKEQSRLNFLKSRQGSAADDNPLSEQMYEMIDEHGRIIKKCPSMPAYGAGRSVMD